MLPLGVTLVTVHAGRPLEVGGHVRLRAARPQHDDEGGDDGEREGADDERAGVPEQTHSDSRSVLCEGAK